MLQVFAYSIEYDDRIVNREADDGQHGGNEEAVDLPVQEVPEDCERAEQHEHVVNECHYCAGPVFESFRKAANRKPDSQIEDNGAGCQEDGDDRLVAELVADGATDLGITHVLNG